MKILFFVGEFPKLSQTFILNQITGLIEAGHDVKILAKKAETNAKVHEDVIKYHLSDRVIYYDKDGKNSRFSMGLRFLKGLVYYYFSNKGPRVNLKFNDLIKYPNLVLLVNSLEKADLADADIIHAHFGPNGLLAQKLIHSGLLQGKLFTTFHGYDMLRFIRQNGEDAYQELFSADNVLLPISEYWKNRCIELGASPEHIIVHHMGINVSKFKFSFVPIVPGKKVKILSVARFVEKKGLEYGIAAVGELLRQGVPVDYSIVGGGPLEETLKNRIAEGGVSEDVHMVGWKTQGELVDIMKEAHIVLLPSVTSSDGDMEGIPVLLMEAMAMGKIVVSTYHSGIPELIQHKVNGFLVKERDVEGLTQTIKGITTSAESCQQVAARARQTVFEKFNIDELNRQLLAIFEGNRPV